MKKLISKQDRIYIAGSNGMAGRAIKNTFINAGYGDESIGGKILTPTRSELDLLNTKLVDEWFENNKPNIVILAAAKVGGIHANSINPATFLIENLKIQTNVIEAAWRNKAKRLLFLGSSCIYPKYAEQPIKEESLLEGQLEKTNEWYAIAKISGIKLCESLRIQYDFDAISLMPTNLYGKGDNYHPTNSHVMASLLRKFHEAKTKNYDIVSCWGTGAPMREFMHVDDLGEASLYVLEKWDPNSDKAPRTKDNKILSYINVGTGKDISIKDLANKIAKIFAYEGTIEWDFNKPDGTPKKQLDISRLSDLGWKAKIQLDEGIKTTLKTIKHDLNNYKN